MSKPLISIIIPTYNRAHLIGETIKSIQKQSFNNWECLIIDDGSTDGSEDFIKSFMANEPRIQYYRKPENRPKGPSSGRNFGFEKSKGDFINFFDSDDLMHPQKLEIDLKNIKSGDYDFTISQSRFFNAEMQPSKVFWNTELWSDDPLNDFIIKKIGWGVNSPLWKRESLLKNNLRFDEYLITADDYFYHIEALSKGMTPSIINKVLVKLRIHAIRLENFKVKSPFKLYVAYRLLSNTALNLSERTISQLRNMSLRQLSTSYKNKDYWLGINYTLMFLVLVQPMSYKVQLLKMLLYGTLYNISNRGYRYLEKGFKKY